MELRERRAGVLVLVVDDDPIIRAVVEATLKAALGVEVALAANGQQALLVAQERLPALVITDVLMPVICGMELVRKLKADPTTSAIPLLVMTATVARRDEAMAVGADEFLDKPFDLSDLLEKVRRQLRLHSLPTTA